MTALKILVFGNVDDTLPKALEKLNALTKSKNGPFDEVFLIASKSVLEQKETFDALQLGKTKLETKVTILVLDEIENELEIEGIDNLKIVYGSGKLILVSGLRIEWMMDQMENLDDALTTPDLLITKEPPENEEIKGVLRERIFPKYHFMSNMDAKFQENQPYKTLVEEETVVTRYISLGKFGSSNRWYYAFNVNTDRSVPITVPENAIENPYKITAKRPREDEVDLSLATPLKRERVERKPVDPSSCFMCLSNPNLQTHLVLSIAEHSYLSLAKGPIIPLRHLLIAPIAHVASFVPGSQEFKTYELERSKYILSLHTMFNSTRPTTTIVYEINKASGVHLNTQVIGIPGFRSRDARSRLYGHAKKHRLFAEKREVKSDEAEYFRFQIFPPPESQIFDDKPDQPVDISAEQTDSAEGLPTENQTEENQTYVVSLPDGKYFDFQFGRKVVADVLKARERIDWRSCVQSEDEEKLDASQFKAQYKEFDFTL